MFLNTEQSLTLSESFKNKILALRGRRLHHWVKKMKGLSKNKQTNKNSGTQTMVWCLAEREGGGGGQKRIKVG